MLGVGAQKSGTTWLHSYLTGSADVVEGPMKEYHVWDACYVDAFRSWKLENEPPHSARALHARWRMQQDNAYYFDYFESQLSGPEKPIALDITPSYSSLPAEVFSKIRREFVERNIRTKAIFLMRDPVERCWSAARYKQVRRNEPTDVAPEIVLRHSRTPAAIHRTRYDITIGNLLKAFDQSDVYVGFFETMFSPEKLAVLSKFCGVPVSSSLAGQKVNAAPKAGDLDTAVRAEIAAQFRPVYEFVGERYPEALSIWPSFRLL